MLANINQDIKQTHGIMFLASHHNKRSSICALKNNPRKYHEMAQEANLNRQMTTPTKAGHPAANRQQNDILRRIPIIL